ncbi:MAG TPA: pitrilysin family protein [Vicinamibacterales bacterium]
MKRLALAIAACVLCGAFVAAQQPATQAQPPTKAAGTILKNRAPVSKEILKVTLPRPQEADLPNGIHLIVLEDHRAPLVTLQMIIPGAGGYYDPPSMPGLAGFTAALMREGTTSKTSEQISEDLDRLAATVGATAGISSPFASVTGSGLSTNLDTVLALMADVLMHPSFTDAEIARYKARTRGALMLNRAQPSFLGQERLSKVVFGDHPSSRISPTPAALDAVSHDALLEFHNAHYAPDHAVLAISGDITAAQARSKAEAVFGSWAKSGAPLHRPDNPAPLTGPSISLVARPASVQTTLLVGTQSIERTNPDFEALTVANRILGGPEARLFEHLREQKGYTYGASSGFSSGLTVGSWIASTDMRTEVTDPVLTDLLDEIRQMRDVPVADKELADHKRAIVAGFARQLESANTVLADFVDVYIYKLPSDYWDKYPERIQAVTAADVQRVAKKYWSTDRLQIVAVGDASKVEPSLAKLGTVQTFDADGKPVK